MFRCGKISASIMLLTFTLGSISGCAALESIGEFDLPGDQISDATPPSDESESENSNVGTESEEQPFDEGLSVPSCDEIYSSELSEKLVRELRTSVGDTSEGDFGFGTTNLDLVGLLQNVRNDLRVSCTWYLPASESVSVTSIAIVSGATQREISGILASAGAASRGEGDGKLFTISSATQDRAPDFIATEVHFLTSVVCPASLAEQSCGAWVSSNYALGQAEPLTIDAANNLGLLED